MNEPKVEMVPNTPGLVYEISVEGVMIGRVKRTSFKKAGAGRVMGWDAWGEGVGLLKKDFEVQRHAVDFIVAWWKQQQEEATPLCEFCNGPLHRDGGCECDVEGVEDRAQ